MFFCLSQSNRGIDSFSHREKEEEIQRKKIQDKSKIIYQAASGERKRERKRETERWANAQRDRAQKHSQNITERTQKYI